MNPGQEWFEVVKHNLGSSYGPKTERVVQTVRGIARAEQLAGILIDRLTAWEKAAGFSVYWRDGGKPPGSRRAPKMPKARKYSGRR